MSRGWGSLLLGWGQVVPLVPFWADSVGLGIAVSRRRGELLWIAVGTGGPHDPSIGCTRPWPPET